MPRVVSLAPNITEMICAIGGTTQLVGRSSACDYPPDAVKTIPVIGDFGVPSLERLLAARPDVVIYTDLADLTLDPKLRRIGLNPVHIPCTRLNDIPPAITRLGQHLQREPEANALAGQLARQIEASRAAVPTSPPPRVLVLIWNDPLTAAGRNTFISDLVTLAGGRNIGDEISRDYFQVSGEWVVDHDPEIIFCFFMAGKESVRQQILNRQGWSNVKAIRDGAVHDGFDNNLVVRPGPRVMQGLELIRPFILNGKGHHE
jgi:iron complex transport system substrate-binding protein